MSDLIKQLGSPPVRRACMGDIEAINLASSTFLHDCADVDLRTFCYWASQVLGGIRFLSGDYADLGVTPRPNWVFWAPVRSPSGKDGESIFVACKKERG